MFHIPGNRVYGKVDYIFIQIKSCKQKLISQIMPQKSCIIIIGYRQSLFSARRLIVPHPKAWRARIYLETN